MMVNMVDVTNTTFQVSYKLLGRSELLAVTGIVALSRKLGYLVMSGATILSVKAILEARNG